MKGQVLLLRAVNVGGHGKLPMAELRTMLDALGARGAQTHLQSGNAVCPEHVDPNSLADRIEATQGFRPMILSIPARDWAYRAATHAFPTDPGKQLHGYFHDGEVLDTTQMEPRLSATERLCAASGVLWLHTPDGIGRSKFAANAERFAGRPMTARNWNTVAAINAMLAVLQDP